MMTPKQYRPAPPAARPTGFGFEDILRNPDHERFMAWYAQFSHFDPGRRKAAGRGEAA